MPTIENCCDCGDECEFALVRAVKTFRGWVKFGWDGVEEITEIYQRMDIHVEMFWRPHAEGTEDPGEICDPGSIPLENRDDTYDIAIEYDRDSGSGIKVISISASCVNTNPVASYAATCGIEDTADCSSELDDDDECGACKDDGWLSMDCFLVDDNALGVSNVTLCEQGEIGFCIPGYIPIEAFSGVTYRWLRSGCSMTEGNTSETILSDTEFESEIICDDDSVYQRTTTTLSNMVQKSDWISDVNALLDLVDLDPASFPIALPNSESFGCDIAGDEHNYAAIVQTPGGTMSMGGKTCLVVTSCITAPADGWEIPLGCFQRSDPFGSGSRPVAEMLIEIASHGGDINVGAIKLIGLAGSVIGVSGIRSMWKITGGLDCEMLTEQTWDPGVPGYIYGDTLSNVCIRDGDPGPIAADIAPDIFLFPEGGSTTQTGFFYAGGGGNFLQHGASPAGCCP